MASLFRHALKSIRRVTYKPLVFPKEGIHSIPAEEKVEEETLPKYATTRYYSATIGQIFQNRYQVVGKLGFGVTSTVWLARDLVECQHVALKLCVKLQSDSSTSELGNELNIYKRIDDAPKDHPGHSAVRSLLDSFDVDGPHGRHRCLVHAPLWDNMLSFKHRNPVARLPPEIIAFVLKRLFLGLDLLHRECNVAHTDIKEANILLSAGSSVLTQFENEELKDPSPRKEVDGGVIYLSRELGIPKDCGAPLLCDFGSAVALDDGVEHREDIQPNVYRAPEVILDIPWSYSVDIWNVGCMVWDAFEGERLFTGRDPEHDTYRGRAHLSEMIALLGPPPASLLERANLKSKFFSDTGEWSAGIPLPSPRTLEDRETALQGEEDREDGELFLRFMRRMLQWEPEKRSSACDLAEDEWILKHTD